MTIDGAGPGAASRVEQTGGVPTEGPPKSSVADKDVEDPAVQDAKVRYELAEKTFKGIMDVVVHLDNKASRVVGAIAFLTGASAAVVSRAASPFPPRSEVAQRLAPALAPYVAGQDSAAIAQAIAGTLTTPRLLLFGFDVSIAFYLAYLLLVLIGTAFYLVAIGPHLQLARFPAATDGIRSRVFYNFIGEVPLETWREHWKDTPIEELRTKMSEDFVSEAWVLSDKLRTKDSLMSFGSFCYRAALIFLAFVALGLLTIDVGTYRLMFLLVSVAFCVGYIVLDWWRESKTLPLRALTWFVIFIGLLIVGLADLITSP